MKAIHVRTKLPCIIMTLDNIRSFCNFGEIDGIVNPFTYVLNTELAFEGSPEYRRVLDSRTAPTERRRSA